MVTNRNVFFYPSLGSLYDIPDSRFYKRDSMNHGIHCYYYVYGPLSTPVTSIPLMLQQIRGLCYISYFIEWHFWDIWSYISHTCVKNVWKFSHIYHMSLKRGVLAGKKRIGYFYVEFLTLLKYYNMPSNCIREWQLDDSVDTKFPCCRLALRRTKR